jgi:isoamylase
MLATVMFSDGTPMLLAGDEALRTQGGNNNAYCQDNEASWFDWSLLQQAEGRKLAAFVARLTALRRAHPALRCPKYLMGRHQLTTGVLDIAWFDENGAAIPPEAWNNPEERTLVLRRGAQLPGGRVSMLTLMLNPTAEDRRFRLPPPPRPALLLLDTADPDAPERPLRTDHVVVQAHSAVLLLADAVRVSG